MLTAEQIAALKDKHGPDLHLLRSPDGSIEVVAKRPGRGEYRRFRRMTLDERKKEDASETFVRDCIVFPDAAELAKIFEVQPGLVDTWASKLIDLAGTAKECEAVPL
jgi:hypothetical protein